MSARANFGVTTALWDRAFGTARPLDVVPVPAPRAMNWLLDARGEVRADHRADYVLVGRRSAAATS